MVRTYEDWRDLIIKQITAFHTGPFMKNQFLFVVVNLDPCIYLFCDLVFQSQNVCTSESNIRCPSHDPQIYIFGFHIS